MGRRDELDGDLATDETAARLRVARMILQSGATLLASFVAKPFERAALLEKIASVLAADPPG